MGAISLPEFAESLFRRFEEAGIPLLLAGGWAVNFHGYSRFTRDVDWVCRRDLLDEAVALMSKLRMVKCSDGMASRFLRDGDLAFMPVDLLWVDAASFDVMASTANYTGRHGDIPVIGLKSLLAMKIYALKDDDSRQGKDLLDIRSLLIYGKAQIPEDELEALCLRYGGPDSYRKVRPQL